jgi:hypothetical protein
MKAKAVILTNSQMPYTVYGMPPKALAVYGMVALVPVIGLYVMGLAKFGYVAALVSVVVVAIAAYRTGREDPHIETVFPACWNFWKGRSSRTLLAGKES